jgi:hypothetical protein
MYGIFKKKVTIAKGSCLQERKSRVSQFEQKENVRFCQESGYSASETLIRQAYGQEA